MNHSLHGETTELLSWSAMCCQADHEIIWGLTYDQYPIPLEVELHRELDDPRTVGRRENGTRSVCDVHQT